MGAPQPALSLVSSHFTGAVLDVGCGLCDNAIWLASLPTVASVTSVDVVADAVAEAEKRLAAAPAPAATKVKIMLGDVLDLPFPTDPPQFDTLLDSAVFHCIGDDEMQEKYLKAVTPHIKVGDGGEA